ncbi:uncharacterized protein JCM6883_002191 [Sporobolomyces salmoneus]|uniref:uncharacterized protein n=1 Tax=Sporobolomyces salmoneus TaxID=183962 RepID=UPI00317BF2E7
MDSTSRPTSNTDTCVYQIDFPSPLDSPSSLRDLSIEILSFVNSVSSRYLWHKQPFTLSLTSLNYSTPLNQGQHQWLEGKTEVTDAVDDEWFIVFLLQQISIKWTEAVVGIEDDDGEFLLIEAADVLPNWVTPQNAANRLWIHQGHLHLIPLEHKSELPFASGGGDSTTTMNPSFDPDEDGFIDRNTAVSLVRDPTINTRAPKEVEETVWARINGYPKKAEEHHHKTLTYLPTELALALEDSPHLITEAVAAFYERDPGMLKACNTMTRFPPSSPLSPSSSSTDSSSLPATVLIPTRLTRPLYSQLLLQKFYAPKPFEKCGWIEGKLGEEDLRRREMGMKIACGFEMLYKQTSPLPRLSSSSSSSFDPSTNSEYQSLLKRLKEKGFFEGVGIEGSSSWTERELSAREAWLSNRDNSPTLSFAQRVDEAIVRSRSRPNPLSDRIESPATLTESKVREVGLRDSEEWLEIDQAGLEEILRSRGREGASGSLEEEGFSDEDDDESEEEEMGEKTREEKEEEKRNRKAAKRLEEMAGKVEDFVQGRGSVQGAVFDDERSDDGEEDSEDEDESMEPPTMTTEERASRLESLVAPLPISEWGQQTSSTSTTTSSVPLNFSSIPSATALKKEPRPAKFEAEKYDGASSDSDSGDEPMPGEEGLKPEGGAVTEDVDDDEEQPAVIDEEEMLDMGEEMDEFLKFATETLGLSDAQYQGILGERRERGAFVPGPAKEKKTNVVPSTSGSKATPSSSSSVLTTSSSAAAPTPTPRQPSRNPNLADFDSLMEQMEKELSNVKKSTPSSSSSSSAKPTSGPRPTKSSSTSAAKPSSSASSSNKVTIETLSDSDDQEDGDEDVEQMDHELQQMLKDMGGEGDGGTLDYNLVKNFLDSFQSQGGFAGPAGNLSGRLGFNLPRNTQQ